MESHIVPQNSLCSVLKLTGTIFISDSSYLLIFLICISQSLYQYPMSQLKYNNIKFLNRSENNQACNLLLEMISDFLEVIPLVWQKISEL